MRSSLENKRVRPSMGLDNYTGFYKEADSAPAKKSTARKRGSGNRTKSTAYLKILGVVVLVAVIGIVASALNSHPAKKPTVVAEKTSKVTAPPSTSKAVEPVATVAPSSGETHCAGNQQAKLVLVSISERHMWACEGAKSVYDSPVITGIASVAETETPTGTYKIYSKQRNVVLTGSDPTGSWNDNVQYWMPFLVNQYGVYGFHDASWRKDSEFGNVDPNGPNGSHGCVNLPTATAAWLYNWAPVGTVVTVAA